MNRSILHIDMDAFYASVEQRDHPEYSGKPVIVGADPKNGKGRGVVSAASYEARRYGIHSAMPISRAYKLCPQGIFVTPHGRRYVGVSEQFMSILAEYTPYVEPISLDEAFLDLTGTERLLGAAPSVGREIKARIQKRLNLTASVGIGPCKMVAKIASDLEKPNGFVYVPSDKAKAFLAPLPVKKLWGVGAKSEARLKQMGITHVGMLAEMKKENLEALFGKMGLALWHYANGEDFSRVIAHREVKSVSNEITFSIDEAKPEVLRKVILQLSEKVGYRIRKQKLLGRTVTLKIRFTDFSTFIRHETLPEPSALTETIYKEAIQLYSRFEPLVQPVRLIGVGMTQLTDCADRQIDIFSAHSQEKRSRITKAVDELKSKFGPHIIGKGGGNHFRNFWE